MVRTKGIFDKLDDKWENTKGKKANDKFNFPAGNYICELKSIKLESDSDGNPKITFTSEIERGEYEGKIISHNLVIKDYSDNFTADDVMDVFRGNLQACGLDTSEISSADLPKFIAALVKKHPLIKIGAVTNKKNPRFKNFFYNGLVEELIEDGGEDEDEDEEDVNEDEDGEDDGENDEGEKDGGEGEDEPQVDDKCRFKPAGKRRALECYIVSVDDGESTVVLKDGKGNEYGDVPWNEMELIFD